MTKEEAQNILLRAFLATNELPKDVQAVLKMLLDLDPQNLQPET